MRPSRKLAVRPVDERQLAVDDVGRAGRGQGRQVADALGQLGRFGRVVLVEDAACREGRGRPQGVSSGQLGEGEELVDEGAEGGGVARRTEELRLRLRIPRRPTRPGLLGMTDACDLPEALGFLGLGGLRLHRLRGTAIEETRSVASFGERERGRVDEGDLSAPAGLVLADGAGFPGSHEALEDRGHPALRELAGEAGDDEVVAGAGEGDVEEAALLGLLAGASRRPRLRPSRRARSCRS